MATIIGTNGNDIRNGTASADTIVGRAGNDQLSGLGGNDRLNGGINTDRLDGGTGTDTADYSNIVLGGTTYIGATAGVNIHLDIAGVQNTGGAGLDTLVSIEDLIGTNFNDRLTGNGGNNVLSGLNGNDILVGNGGADQLFGGNGNEYLNGGTGNDVLNGGAGIDYADYTNGSNQGQAFIGATSGVTVDLNMIGQQNTGGAGLDTLVGIENINATNFDDILIGNVSNNKLLGKGGDDFLDGLFGNDTLDGGDGNDKLLGYFGNDTLNGENGNDTLNGENDNDTLNGGSGDDTLIGGGGADHLTGGAGQNVFVYQELSDSLAGASRDIIADFSSSFDDIDLRGVDADETQVGNQAFTYIGSAPFTFHFGIFLPHQLRYDNGILQGNTDFDGAAEFEIELAGAPSLSVSDLFL